MSFSFSDYSYYNLHWKLVYTLFQFSLGLTTARYVHVPWLTLYVDDYASLNTVIAPIKFWYRVRFNYLIQWRAVLILI